MKIPRPHAPRCAALVLILLSGGDLEAQSQATTGVIRGSVRDQFDNPVAEAAVALRETRTNYERTLSSSDLGLFTATLLPLGDYEVTVRAPGWSEVRQTGVQVRVGETVELTVRLLPRMEEIVVEAGAPAVDATRTEAATRLPEEAVRDLPNNGRNFLNLTLLTPGAAIVQGPDGDELSIAGQRGIHNNVSVDGADFNNPFFGEQRGRPAPGVHLQSRRGRGDGGGPPGGQRRVRPLQRRLRQRRHQVGRQRAARLAAFLRQERGPVRHREARRVAARAGFQPGAGRLHPGRAPAEGPGLLLHGLRSAAAQGHPAAG